MIFLITNRNLTHRTDHRMFGDDFHTDGPEFLRAAEAKKQGKSWRLTLMPEEQMPASQRIFEALMADEKPVVFFVHGFNQDQEKNLEKAAQIASYEVNVVCFSWPSNPGPQFPALKGVEYKRARKNARRSTIALERTLEKFFVYHQALVPGVARPPMTLVVHSLGNTLLEHVVLSPVFEDEGNIFRNVVLHQADAAANRHHAWVTPLARAARTYVTLNENDWVLGFADLLETNRLGNTARDLVVDTAIYVDFTDSDGVHNHHRLWDEPAVNNANIKAFFTRVFRGLRPDGAVAMTHNPTNGAWHIH